MDVDKGAQDAICECLPSLQGVHTECTLIGAGETFSFYAWTQTCAVRMRLPLASRAQGEIKARVKTQAFCNALASMAKSGTGVNVTLGADCMAVRQGRWSMATVPLISNGIVGRGEEGDGSDGMDPMQPPDHLFNTPSPVDEPDYVTVKMSDCAPWLSALQMCSQYRILTLSCENDHLLIEGASDGNADKRCIEIEGVKPVGYGAFAGGQFRVDVTYSTLAAIAKPKRASCSLQIKLLPKSSMMYTLWKLKAEQAAPRAASTKKRRKEAPEAAQPPPPQASTVTVKVDVMGVSTLINDDE